MKNIISIIHNGSEKMKKDKKNKDKPNYQLISLAIINILLIIIIFLVLAIKINCKIETKNITIETKEENLKNENIVFLGDSITDWYPISEMYSKDIPIVNSGIAGYETKDIINRLDELVYQYNPTKVFVLIGTNDLKYKDDDEKKVVENIKKIVTEIKKYRPKTKIYIQSIFPVNRELEYNATEERYNEEIKTVNKQVKEYCLKSNITYINIYDELIDDKGNLAEKYTVDGLHLSTKGYIKLTSK